jgi:ABC-type uncharacterized transport system permease subunit
VQVFLNKSRAGLNLRAVGENPGTADAAGINVTKNKYLATCIGAGISGLGGLYYVMDYTKGTWANDDTHREAWAGWQSRWLSSPPGNPSMPSGALTCSAFCSWMYLYIPGLTRSSQEMFKMLPYLVTIAVLIVISLRSRKENQPPASLGLSYFREESNRNVPLCSVSRG